MKLLYISIHPIQNAKPYRLMQQVKGIASTVLYLQQADASDYSGKENITKQAFDNDMLSGYRHYFLQGQPGKQKTGFFSHVSLKVWKYVQQNDVVVIYGHSVFTFWIAMLAARVHQKKLILTTDATYMEATAESGGFKMKLKPAFLRWLYNHVSHAVFVPSTASKLFLESVGIQSGKIVIIPYAVDEDLIQEAAALTNKESLLSTLGIPVTDMIFIFCAKFIERKRPMDAIEAFAMINHQQASLIMIGEGPLMGQLTARVNKLGLTHKIIFTGLIRYTELPKYYTASNVLVFCSDHEPYGLPVNEAMLCGLPVIVSDRIGARLDLVEENKTGWIYPSGNIKALSQIMQKAVNDTLLLHSMGINAKEKMKNWSSVTNIERQINFFKNRNWLA